MHYQPEQFCLMLENKIINDDQIYRILFDLQTIYMGRKKFFYKKLDFQEKNDLNFVKAVRKTSMYQYSLYPFFFPWYFGHNLIF